MKKLQLRNLSYRSLLVVFFLFVSLDTTAVVKISISNGNWSNSSTWSPSGVPSSADKIYIYHTVTLDQNFTASDTVFVCSVLNFNSNKVLTLGTGMLVLVNNSQYNGRIGTMGSNSNISGSFIFQKWVTRCDGFSTYGSPFDVQATDFNWYYCYRCMPSWSNIYFYDETKPGSMENGYYDSIPGKIKRGTGFYYWYSNYTGGQNFPRQISLKGSSDFTNEFVFPITKTTSNVTSGDGYNLISNPFPGTIDWLSGGWTKRRVNNAIYTWNNCLGLYSSYVWGVAVNGGSRYISSMQGFWVQASRNNPQLKVSSDALVDDSKSLLRPSETEPLKILRLSLQEDEIAILMNDSASSGLDSLYDALKFFSDNSSISSGSDTLDFAINSVPSGNRVIPVKVKGSGTLHVSGVNTFGDYTLYLRDLTTGLLKQMIGDFDYMFTDTSTVSFSNRFEIVFRKNNVTGIEEEHYVNMLIKSGNEVLTVVPQGFRYPISVSVCDLLGRQLLNQTYEQEEINLPKWNEPVIIRISDKSNTLVKKVF